MNEPLRYMLLQNVLCQDISCELVRVQRQVLKDFQSFHLEQIHHQHFVAIQQDQITSAVLGFQQRPHRHLLAMIRHIGHLPQQLNQKGLHTHSAQME